MKREYRKTYETESLILESIWLIEGIMKRRHVTQLELALRLGKSGAHISQLLSGSTNMSLRTLAEVGFALGYRVLLECEPIADGND